MADAEGAREHDLIRLQDDEGGLRMRILRRSGPGTLPDHDSLDAAIEISGPFVQGRLDDILIRTDLAEWSSLLDELANGREVTWRDSGRTPVVSVRPWTDGDGADVSVLDEPSSGVEVHIPVQLSGSWVAEHRALLRAVEAEFPAEVLEESPGVFRWRHQGG